MRAGGRMSEVPKTGSDPDVLSIDPGLGWLYVAEESSVLMVFDIKRPGLTLVGHDHLGDASHSVVVDAATTHHMFLPIATGAHGKPALRILQPGGLAGG